MFKGLIALLITLSLFIGVTYAGEGFTISGDLTFQYEGDIYVCLLTMEAFQVIRERNPSPPYLKIIKVDAALKKAGRVSFEFVKIPKGTYSIIAYQETIKNSKFDFNPFFGTSKEPYGSYRAMPPERSSPDWTVIKFDLDENLTGIEIQM
jgi:hypothetical protein